MKNPNFHFFWKGPLSQWYSSPFEDSEGITFNCAEQYMMWRKAILFKDEGTAAKILAAKHPREQKKLGREVNGFIQEMWDHDAENIVLSGNVMKFYQNPDLLKILLATGDKVLVEASPFDTIWGIGLTEDDPRAQSKDTWCGQNKLGYVLMNVRSVFRKP